MPDIRIENLSFTYAGSSTPVLHTLNLTIPQGEFVLLAGPSGCGKSTLALVMAGLIPSRIVGRLRGGIYLGEKHISRMDIHEVSQHVGMVFQNPDEQLVHLDAESEVAFGPENLCLPQAEVERRVEEALSFTGMAAQRFQETFSLSGGQKQRVAISATLAMRPGVLILDEPTSDLDPVGTQEVLSVLKMLNKQYRMTIVLIEHKIDEVITWVDRVLLMEEGRVVVDAPSRAAFNDVARWQRMGVAVPQSVLLARALPEIFHGETPLSIEEVHAGLQGTRYVQALSAYSEIMRTLVDGPQNKMENKLSWDHVGLAYGEKEVLREINLNVASEEWVAVIGPNGSGKTSLASLAMGFQPPTRGTVRHHGKKVEVGKISQQSERMAYLFQAADTMLFGATVEQEFLFGVKHRRKRDALPFSVDQLLETVDLTHYKQSNPFHLSFGQRKRLAIGVLLTRYPDVLILDEPTTGQDEGHARAFLQFLQYLREEERLTYIMITHDMHAVASYASRVVVLRDGHILLDGSPRMVFAQTDALEACSILAPPVARLHARLCGGNVQHVALTIEEFLRAIQPAEVIP